MTTTYDGTKATLHIEGAVVAEPTALASSTGSTALSSGEAARDRWTRGGVWNRALST